MLPFPVSILYYEYNSSFYVDNVSVLYPCMHVRIFILYIVYSQHAPLPSVILHALPDHLHIVLLVSY